MEDLYSLTPNRSVEAQELNRMVRLLAQAGKTHFKQYLYDPLYAAGWERKAGEARKMLAWLVLLWQRTTRRSATAAFSFSR